MEKLKAALTVVCYLMCLPLVLTLDILAGLVEYFQ
jgi:hypothetical protein